MKQTIPGPQGEKQADDTLKAVYDIFSAEYVLKTRQPPPAGYPASTNPFRGALLNALATAAAPTHPFPALTPNGFSELLRIHGLVDPEKAWKDWNIVLRHYDLPIWRERGDIPRAALPAEPVPAIVQWVRQRQERVVGRVQTEAAQNQALRNMQTRMVNAQMQSSMESIEDMGNIGTGYHVTYQRRWL